MGWLSSIKEKINKYTEKEITVEFSSGIVDIAKQGKDNELGKKYEFLGSEVSRLLGEIRSVPEEESEIPEFITEDLEHAQDSKWRAYQQIVDWIESDFGKKFQL